MGKPLESIEADRGKEKGVQALESNQFTDGCYHPEINNLPPAEVKVIDK